jgi:hypothetical protein
MIFRHGSTWWEPFQFNLENTVSWMCSRRATFWRLDKGTGVWQFTWKPYIYPQTIKRGNPGKIIVLFYIPLEFQPKMKNWTFRHSTGFINCTNFHRQSAFLRVPTVFVFSRTNSIIRMKQTSYRGLLLKKNKKSLAQTFNFTFRYIDDVLSLNNSKFGEFVDRIYPYWNKGYHRLS